MKRKIFWFLIWFANKFKGDYYDFGEPVVSLIEHKKRLFCATKGSIFVFIEELEKWKKVS